MLNPVEKLEAMLDYRLPASGKPMQSIVMPREDAHKLLMHILRLELELKNKFTTEIK